MATASKSLAEETEGLGLSDDAETEGQQKEKVWEEQSGKKGPEHYCRNFVRCDSDKWATIDKKGSSYLHRADSALFDKQLYKKVATDVDYQFAFKFTKLCHVTSLIDDEKEGVKGILSSNGFSGGKKTFGMKGGKEVSLCVSWWGIDMESAMFKIGNSEGASVNGQEWCKVKTPIIESAVKRLLAKSAVIDWYGHDGTEAELRASADSKASKSQSTPQELILANYDVNEKFEAIAGSFANSPAFKPESRYGNFKFTIPLEVLFDKYNKSFCPGATELNLAFREGGTFYYKQEIMHVIIVHPKHVANDDLKSFAEINFECPGDCPAVLLNDSTWIWKPDSTGTEMIYLNEWPKQTHRELLWNHCIKHESLLGSRVLCVLHGK